MTIEKNAKRAAIYCRVSTNDQTVANQLGDLRRYARDRGWQIVDEVSDEGISGTKVSRPGLDRLMDAARKRKFDILLVWRFDRFARSIKHLVLALEELHSLNIDFISYQENIDTSSPLGQVMFTITAAMAAFERNIIVQRVHAGLRRAKSEGKKLGRPLAILDVEKAIVLQKQGLPLAEIATRLKVGKATVYRALRRVSKSMSPQGGPESSSPQASASA
jgi:DNA invertase Pin-like site-specific DNA recombinase